MRLLATSLTAALIVGAAMAASPVGKWNGKIQMGPMPKMPANMPPEQKKMVDSMLAMVKKMVIKLDVRADKTYTVSTTNPQTGKPQVEKGTWSQTGNQITMKGASGQAGGRAQSFTLAPNGKTMSMALPGRPGAGAGGKVVFTKA